MTRMYPIYLCLWLAATSMAGGPNTISLEPDGAVLVQREGIERPQRFEPRFLVMFRADDPKLASRPAKIGKVTYPVPTWQVQQSQADVLAKVNTAVTAGDGFDDHILKGDQTNRTVHYFAAAAHEVPALSTASIEDDRIVWRFAKTEHGELSASLQLPSGDGSPVLDLTFTPARDGWYSIGYVGAPAIAADAIDEIFQPLIWNYRRFPERSFLTPAFHCTVPTAFVRKGDTSLGVAADPMHLPFQPLPRPENSQFGVLLRDADGQARPMCFAPVMGGMGSQMASGEPFTFTMRLIVEPGTIDQAFERVARDLCGFADFRRNTTQSLNQTLENMIAYGLSDFSRFDEELRGCSYATDVPGAVKNVSAMHPLAMAMIADDVEIYERRARPIIESMLSREKLLFATSPEVKIQDPSWRLNGPCAPLSELTALHVISQGRNPLLLQLAQKMLTKAQDTWQNRLALYDATGDRQHLDRAVALADAYLDRECGDEPPSYRERGGFFWNAFVPSFYELLELFEATGESRYLAAAHRAARDYAQFIWMTPRVPDDSITVNEGGLAPQYWYLKGKGHQQMPAPQESVDAWRLSEIGLLCESAGTSQGHRAVMMANHAPWFLRLGQLTHDDFLRSLGRHAIIGRYTNFPGYHINTARTTVYEKPDYPLREHEELSYNSFHYNHIWPHIALLVDYLVSDAVTRGDGAVSFPSRYAEGYGYLKNKVYGDRPGRFYGDENAWLWMPRGLLTIDDVQLNYVAARGDGTLYLALTNQSPAAVETTVHINPELVHVPAGATPTVRVWRQNRPADSMQLTDHQVRVGVEPMGITALAIDGVQITPRFQRPPNTQARTHVAYAEQPFAEGAVGTLLSMGPDLTSAYIYLKATFETTAAAVLHFRFPGSDWRTVNDTRYPYEFTIELPPDAASIEYFIETTSPSGTTSRSEPITLAR